MKLHQLPSGDWIDLESIKAITALPQSRCEFTRYLHRSRMVVHTHGEMFYVCYANDDEHATQMRDALAKLTNHT